jgi:hypothetical protein
MDLIKWIEDWYQSQCDGDWEHTYGVEITTIDNPGWSVKIDLEGTDLAGLKMDYELVEKSDDDWYGFKIENNVFEILASLNLS